LDRATECLDLSEIAPNVVQDVGVETALLLKEIFDRIELPPFKEIQDKDASDFASMRNWRVPHTAITIVKIEEGPRKGEFLFSSGRLRASGSFMTRSNIYPISPVPRSTPMSTTSTAPARGYRKG
ncbi:MAG: hypothetical protein JRF72_01780, partial [Deltaproteobacteria bacterium]|nr:hypothetical protein [Deltaproteobacteria bacterium]